MGLISVHFPSMCFSSPSVGGFGAAALAPSVPLPCLKANMWTVLPDGVPTILIALTWILWRQTILQTAGAQSEPTWNMPPATFTLGSTLFQMEHFHLYLWLFYRQTWSPHGAPSAKWFIPPPAATSTVVKGWRDGGKIYFKLSKPGDAVNKGRGDIVFVFKPKSCAHHSHRRPPPGPTTVCCLQRLHEFTKPLVSTLFKVSRGCKLFSWPGGRNPLLRAPRFSTQRRSSPSRCQCSNWATRRS